MLTNKNVGLFYIKSGCLLFWGSWFFLTFLTNVFDFLYQYGMLASDWTFRSGNYQLLTEFLSRYHSVSFILEPVFTLDILVEFISSILFMAAFISYWRQKNPWLLINLAFGLSMALWAVFLIMGEIYVTYIFAPAHMTLFIFSAISLLCLHLLPD